MNNPNAGKNAFIPLGNHSAASVKKQEAAILENIKQVTGSANFSRPSKEKAQKVLKVPKPAPEPVVKPVSVTSQVPKRKPSGRITKLKGVYFEIPVYDALVKMQAEGQNASVWVNNLVKANLGI